ncbi:hypothetical protein IscW_ISCW015746, partial [Ixodes scapularis]
NAGRSSPAHPDHLPHPRDRWRRGNASSGHVLRPVRLLVSVPGEPPRILPLLAAFRHP